MAEKLYKVNEVIELGYQAPGAKSDLTIKADIYNPSKELVSVGVPLQEVGSSGTYRGSFTPTIGGTWQVIMYTEVDSYTRDSQVTKSYSVGLYNLEDVGIAVDALQTALNDLGDVATSGDITAAQGVITNAIEALHDIDASEVQAAAAAAITAAGLATATNVSDAQSAIATLINALNNLSAAQVQAAAAAAITTANLATATAVGDVQTKCNTIETKIDALDTPAMAF